MILYICLVLCVGFTVGVIASHAVLGSLHAATSEVKAEVAKVEAILAAIKRAA